MEDIASDAKDVVDLGDAVNSYPEEPEKLKKWAVDKGLDGAYSEVSEENQYQSKIVREGGSGYTTLLQRAFLDQSP